MPVYVRAEALEVPAPTISECSDSTVPDPDEIFPERKGALGMMDNILSEMFDNCWEKLAKKESEKQSQAKLEANNVEISKFVESDEEFTAVHVLDGHVIAVSAECKLCSFNSEGGVVDTWSNPDENPILTCRLFPFEPIDGIIHVVVIDDLGGAYWLTHVHQLGFCELKSLTSDTGPRTICDDVTASLNGTIISASLSSQIDSWVSVWRVPGQMIKNWKTEMDSKPETPEPEPVATPPLTSETEITEEEEVEKEPETTPPPPIKWKPNLTFSGAATKLKKPKHTVQSKKSSYSELKAAVDYEADITGDESLYLLTEEMKTFRSRKVEEIFYKNFPHQSPPTSDSIAIDLNSPCMSRVLDPVSENRPDTDSAVSWRQVASRAGSRTASGKVKQYSVAVAQPNATKLFIYSLAQKTPSAKLTPFVALPHTDKISTFTIDTVTTLYIATCCSNGTITLWKRESETHIVPVYIAPALNKVTCDLMYLSYPVHQPPVLVALDRNKTLFAIRHDPNKFLNLFNKRVEIFENVQELYANGNCAQIAKVNSIFIYWTDNIAELVRKWKVFPNQSDLPSLCPKEDVFYFTDGGELKVGKFV